jgi:hypothetical protein
MYKALYFAEVFADIQKAKEGYKEQQDGLDFFFCNLYRRGYFENSCHAHCLQY